MSTAFDEIINEVKQSGAKAARKLWLPPLPRLRAGPVDPLGPTNGLVLRIGDRDRPEVPEVSSLDIDLEQKNILVMGGPASGKTTLLSSLALQLARRYEPHQLGLFVLGYGGGLTQLEQLPHLVGRFGLDADSALAGRALRYVRDLIHRRARSFRDAGVSTFAAWSSSPEAEETAFAGRLVVLVDGIGTANEALGDPTDIAHVVRLGRPYGVHAIITGSRRADIPLALRASFGSLLEFRLADPSDSMVSMKLAALVRSDNPGRGYTQDHEEFQAAVPLDEPTLRERAERVNSPEAEEAEDAAGLGEALDVDDALGRALAEVVASSKGPRNDRFYSLPDVVPAADLPAPVSDAIPIGLEEFAKRAFTLDLLGADGPHLLIAGSPRSGKSALVRLVITMLRRALGAIDVVLLDPRGSHRSLLGPVNAPVEGPDRPPRSAYAQDLDDIGSWLKELPKSIALRRRKIQNGESVPALIVVMDDVHIYESRPEMKAIMNVVAQAESAFVHFVAASAPTAGYAPFQTLVPLAFAGASVVALDLPAKTAVPGGLVGAPSVEGRAQVRTTLRTAEVQIGWMEPLEQIDGT